MGEAELAKAMMSLPAVKAFEIGEGFNCCRMRGSDHNDLFVGAGHGLLDCKTNHAGGTLGGISTGLPLIMRMGVKPASSISRDQETCTLTGTSTSCRSRAGTTRACSLGVRPLWR